jgi:hypothetical protein
VFGEGDFLAREILRTHDLTNAGELAFLVDEPDQKFAVQTIAEADLSTSGEAYYRLEAPFEAHASGTLYAFRKADEQIGDLVPGKLKLTAALPVGSVIRTWDNVGRRITAVDAGMLATVDPDTLAPDSDGHVPYIAGAPVSGRVSPFIKLDSTVATSKRRFWSMRRCCSQGAECFRVARRFVSMPPTNRY